MNINLIVVGKIKEKYYKQACDEYLKRLSRYHKVKIYEVKDEKAPEKLSLKEEENIKDIEGKKIEKYINSHHYIIALDIKGQQLDSIQLSKKIQQIALEGTSEISFIIGGSLGLSKRILDKATYRLSFSNMTFPHQLMRVILLEQIYRASKINNNEPYHK